MARQERDILQRAVRVVSEQATAASDIVDEALDAGLDVVPPRHPPGEDAPPASPPEPVG